MDEKGGAADAKEEEKGSGGPDERGDEAECEGCRI